MKNYLSKRQFVCPYLFSLFVTVLVLLLICYFLIFYFIFQPPLSKTALDTFIEYLPLFIFLLLVLCLFIGGCLGEMYCLCGTYQFTIDSVVMHAPFRKTIQIYYDEVKCSGIDYDLINGSYQFWIYLSKDYIPPKYCGRVSRLPITESTIRVLYSEGSIKSFISFVPETIKRELRKSEKNMTM